MSRRYSHRDKEVHTFLRCEGRPSCFTGAPAALSDPLVAGPTSSIYIRPREGSRRNLRSVAREKGGTRSRRREVSATALPINLPRKCKNNIPHESHAITAFLHTSSPISVHSSPASLASTSRLPYPPNQEKIVLRHCRLTPDSEGSDSQGHPIARSRPRCSPS